MRTEAGENELLLLWRPAEDGAEILQVQTGDRDVRLPETAAGRPVTAVGDHAFSPDRPPPAGEALRITCGGPREADNREIRRITLPPTVRRVGDYAFYNCTGLRELRLEGPVERWGGSVFMNCRELGAFSLREADGRAETVSYLADELARELDITVEYPDGGKARLIFPEYREDYEENPPAHHFDYAIYGAGYPYHHVFQGRALPLRAYDALFPGLLAAEHDPLCALRLAWYRLRTPRDLAPEAEERYWAYLRRHAADALRFLLAERDSRGLGWFLPRCGADRAALEEAAEAARRLGAAEAVALLLEQRHRQFPKGAARTFDL